MTEEQSNLRITLRKKPLREYEEEIVAQRYGRNATPNLSENTKPRTDWSLRLASYKILNDLMRV